jgi:multisubunit Na+/H+ antiporter MnhB subunit
VFDECGYLILHFANLIEKKSRYLSAIGCFFLSFSSSTNQRSQIVAQYLFNQAQQPKFEFMRALIIGLVAILISQSILAQETTDFSLQDFYSTKEELNLKTQAFFDLKGSALHPYS